MLMRPSDKATYSYVYREDVATNNLPSEVIWTSFIPVILVFKENEKYRISGSSIGRPTPLCIGKKRRLTAFLGVTLGPQRGAATNALNLGLRVEQGGLQGLRHYQGR